MSHSLRVNEVSLNKENSKSRSLAKVTILLWKMAKAQDLPPVGDRII